MSSMCWSLATLKRRYGNDWTIWCVASDGLTVTPPYCVCTYQVEAAVQRLEPLLKPVADEENEWKQKQLKELAIINGELVLSPAVL